MQILCMQSLLVHAYHKVNYKTVLLSEMNEFVIMGIYPIVEALHMHSSEYALPPRALSNGTVL